MQSTSRSKMRLARSAGHALSGLVFLMFAEPAVTQHEPQWATPTPPVPLFFQEPWRQVTPLDEANGWATDRPVTQEAVTNDDLELRLYDPLASEIPAMKADPPRYMIPRDFDGPSCVVLSGYNQDPPPRRVVHGEPTDPPNLWTGACLRGVVVTLRNRNSYVDLTGFAKIRWVTRTSGFHVVRPVVKLADGRWLVGDYTEGAAATNSMQFLETEFPISTIRWLELDVEALVTRGTWVQSPDLSRVDEVGFADLHPGSGHGWGGFVNVGRIEVYGAPVER